MFIGVPEHPPIHTFPSLQGEVWMVRAFYANFDAIGPPGRHEFALWDALWRERFPCLAYMDFRKDTAEAWVYTPHPRIRVPWKSDAHLYGLSRAPWFSFIQKSGKFLDPELPAYLRS